jgi:hypothetical protein
MSQIIAPEEIQVSAGTWTLTTSTQHWFNRRSRAGAGFVLRIQAKVLQNSVALKGALLKSVDVWYKIATADGSAFTAKVWKEALIVDAGTWVAPVEQTTTLDAGHDTAAKRYAQADHKMTLTLSTPIWLDDDDNVFVELAVTAAATTDFDFIAARFNYTARL